MKQLLFKLTLATAMIVIDGNASAQWAIGLQGGWNSTTISRYNGGRMDETYSALGGFNMALQGHYTVTPWLAIRADLGFMQRSHRMDRNLNYIDPVYTEHVNAYLMLPLMTDFSFGGERLRGHLLTGAYICYWLSERRNGTTFWMTDYYVYFEPFDETRKFTTEDQRLNAGTTLGIGLSYALNTKWELGVDAQYYYDLTSHHKGAVHLSDPRYLNTLSVSINVNYKL